MTDYEDLTYQLEELDKELKFNIENFHKLKKQTFHFGQHIMLQHVRTFKYLSLKRTLDKKMNTEQYS